MPHAARTGDEHVCDLCEEKPHEGGQIDDPCSPDVRINGVAHARATDSLTCVGTAAKNYIVTGSKTVRINGLLAARATDKTMHSNSPSSGIKTASNNVCVGGARAGCMLGNWLVAKNACEEAKKTRGNDGKKNNPVQSHANGCNQESARQVINQQDPTRPPVGEETVYQRSVLDSDATGNGSMSQDQLSDSLGQYDIESEVKPWSSKDPLADMEQDVADGKAVFVQVDAMKIGSLASFGSLAARMGKAVPHTVILTGIQYDENGKRSAVRINDTGSPDGCGKEISAKHFEKSILPESTGYVATKAQIWKRVST